tara:strand:- start:9265 stop:10977 length:1713 start_codon:yes stop_codon:yes gene_type:complete
MFTPQSIDSSVADRNTGLAQDLIAAWPPEDDLNEICELPIGLSTHLHMKLCTPSSAHKIQQSESPRTVLQRPAPGAHPVLIARKLLLISSILQGAISCPESSGAMRDRFSMIMSRAFDTATKLVTTNDDLTASVEGIECIMVEAMIQNYAGNLHRSWIAVRRASAVAQVVGLHRRCKYPSLKILDPTTRAGLDPEQLYFRIVEMDSYLSVTLGLPRSSLDAHALTAQALAGCQPLDRMARLQCIIAGRIIDRKGRHTDTQEIDQMLQEAANAMPPQWWLTPVSKADDEDPPDGLRVMARAMYQLSHYHLVVRLHLPHLLRSCPEDGSDYNKLAAATASREILSRYLSFRTQNPGHFYCRGIDFLAFIALTVLCLAHIDSQSSAKTSDQLNTCTRQVLVHSHPSNRGLMEHILTVFERMQHDEIACKLAPIMRHILEVEADASNGAAYTAATNENDDGSTECEGVVVNDRKSLQLHIPHFGTIKLDRRSVSKPSGQSPLPPIPCSEECHPGVRTEPEGDSQCTLQPPGAAGFESNDFQFLDLEAPDDWTLQNINESLFESLFEGMDSEVVQ